MADSAFRLGHASLEEQVVGGELLARTHEASDQQAAGGGHNAWGAMRKGAFWGGPS